MQEQLSLWGYDGTGAPSVSGERVVYFVDDGEFIKIGFTTRDAGARVREWATGNPNGLKVIATIVVKDGEDDRRFHRMFAEFHHRNEWFRKSAALMQAIRVLSVPRVTYEVSVPPGARFLPWSLSLDCACCSGWTMVGPVAVQGALPAEGARATSKCTKCGYRFDLVFVNGGSGTSPEVKQR